jgi:ankyrin repeat protein
MSNHKEMFDSDTNKLLEIIHLLLRSGSNPNAEKTAVDENTFLTKKTQQDSPTNLSHTPLHYICKVLQQRYSNSETATSYAITRLEQCTVLLKQHGAIVGPDTVLLMHDAARRNNILFLSFMMDRLGIDPNTRGRQGLTALHFAARSGHISVVQLLLALNVDTSVTDDLGLTALDAARVNQKDDVVRLLEVHSIKK